MLKLSRLQSPIFIATLNFFNSAIFHGGFLFQVSPLWRLAVLQPASGFCNQMLKGIIFQD